jgi:citrate lyase subunit gamma (acyl carrier protein)
MKTKTLKIKNPSKAGTLESNDILAMVFPNDDKGIELELESIVIKQFGNHIRQVILEKIDEMGIKDILIKVEDKGALDYTIAARVETAIKRSL